LLRAVVKLPARELAASLEHLATAELLGPAESSGERAFRHPLTQEVAYRTQLVDRRRGTHAAVARALLTIHGSAAPTHAVLLAHHFDEAGERLEAARWHEQAGRRVARSEPADGVRHCRRVATLLAGAPESRETLMLELTSRIALLEIGRIAGIEEDEARDLFDEAHAVAERLPDKAGHAFLLASYGRLCGLAGDVRRYLACAERSAELAEGSEAALEFEMRSVLAHAQLAVGRLASACATAERALTEVARVAGLRVALGRSTALGLCRVWWALASAHLGRTAEAEAVLEALLEEESERALQAIYGTHAFLCEVRRLRGDRAGALAHGRRAVELAEEHGSVFSRVEAAAFLGAAELEHGDLAAATSLLEQALALARHRRTGLWYEPRILATLADASLAAGHRAGARALLSEARELVDRGRGWRLGAFDVELAWVHLLASEPAADRTAIAGALESVDALTAELGSDRYRHIAALERARLMTLMT
jgi:tetratricopeptide (TPR) repeat protein